MFLLQIDLHEGNIPLHVQCVLINPNRQMNSFNTDLERKLKTGSVGSWFIILYLLYFMMSSYFMRFRWKNSWSGFKIPVQSSSFCPLLFKNETYKTIDYIHMLVEIVGCNNKFRQLSSFNLAWINCSMPQWVRKMWRHLIVTFIRCYCFSTKYCYICKIDKMLKTFNTFEILQNFAVVSKV